MKSIEYFEAACEMQENVEVHPFAYRTHTHKLGVVNSGYVVKTDESTGRQEWIEIGRRSPQLPQMFFPASNKVTINKGDVLAARCTMKNFRDHTVRVGSTGDDEMCNFYMMYYVKGDHILTSQTCFTMGPPYYHLDDFRVSFPSFIMKKTQKIEGV
jgi:peptidylglycine monooxygenase